MKENNFVYADLSTYDLKITKSFYSNVFEWNYQDSGNGYFVAQFNGKEISGLYETPQKFKDMNMPSFWMSYIQVNSIEQTVEKAKELGGIIELVDKENPIGKIALIRDPLGAGFTIYQGNQLNARTQSDKKSLVWNELFISDLSMVKDFYEGIFNWKIQETKDKTKNRHLILNSLNEEISAIQVVSNDVKGKFEYWSVFFGVENVEETKKRVLENGGSLVYEDQYLTSLADSFGAFFQIIPI